MTGGWMLVFGSGIVLVGLAGFAIGQIAAPDIWVHRTKVREFEHRERMRALELRAEQTRALSYPWPDPNRKEGA